MTAPRQGRATLFVLRLLTALLLGVMLLVVCAGLVVLAHEARYSGRIYAGVSIMGIDVGGLTRQQAREQVTQEVKASGLCPLTLAVGEQAWPISAEALGGYVDIGPAIDEAWWLGRSGVFRADLLTRARLLWWGYDIIPAFDIEPGTALIYLRELAREAAQPARQARLWVAGSHTEVTAAQAGADLDVAASQEAIVARVRQALGSSGWGQVSLVERWLGAEAGLTRLAGSEPLAVELVFQELVLPTVEVQRAQESLDLLLSGPITLSYGFEELAADGLPQVVTRTWVLDEAVLASWATQDVTPAMGGSIIEISVDAERVQSFAQSLADEIDRAPREGRFDYDPASHTLRTIEPGQTGHYLDVAATTSAILVACFSGERNLELPVKTLRPLVTRADIEALMPLQLISEGETNFAGSTAERLQNIEVATAQFQGVPVPAHSVFSFLEHLGAVTAASGYSEAWVIYGDRTVLGPGGGVCQVSTTCFRAAFWGGFPIVARSPHAYRVSWYEPPLGLDAAVFSPVTDFKFENDTDYPLLMLTQVDEANSKLYFRLYGVPTGRQVTLEGPETSNPTQPGAPVYEEDPSLSPGTTVQVERAREGIDVVLYRVIVQNGEVKREEFVSHYAAWPARYKVAPGEAPTSASE